MDKKNKVEALLERMLEECKRQEFTVFEVQHLLALLNIALENRQREWEKELF